MVKRKPFTHEERVEILTCIAWGNPSAIFKIKQKYQVNDLQLRKLKFNYHELFKKIQEDIKPKKKAESQFYSLQCQGPIGMSLGILGRRASVTERGIFLDGKMVRMVDVVQEANKILERKNLELIKYPGLASHDNS